MKFPLTPEEAQRPALAVAKHYIRRNMRVKVEVSAWPDAPCRTTIVAMKSGLHILVEAQGTLNYSGAIKALADWLASRRCYAELYLATMEDATFQAKMLADMK